jgi:prophage regulatory protein
VDIPLTPTLATKPRSTRRDLSSKHMAQAGAYPSNASIQCRSFAGVINMQQSESSDKILRLPAVLQRTGICKTTVYRRIKDGTFPAMVQLSKRCIGWRESDINRWIASPSSFSR